MFQDAFDYLEQYYKNCVDASLNKKPRRWFFSEASTIDDVIEDTFGSSKENSTYVRLLNTPNTSIFKLMVERIKIAFLSSARHDLRAQFSVGFNNYPKTPVDIDRHAVNFYRSNIVRMEDLKRSLDVKS